MLDKIGQILVTKKVITALDLNEALKRKEREPNKYFGQILHEMGLPQSKIIRELYYGNKRKQLGQILVERNIITEAQLQDNLLQQKDLKNRRAYTPLGILLVKNRVISEEKYMDALSAHFIMPIVSLKDYGVSPSLQKAIGEEYALQNRIVVLNNNHKKVTVAVAEPHLLVFEKLERAMPKGKDILFCLARASEIEGCLDKTYDPYTYSAPRPLR
jgi:hypothetical protein